MNSVSAKNTMKRIAPWALACLVAACVAIAGFEGFTGYVLRWGGSMFQAASGALLGFAITRHLQRLNLSTVASEFNRAIAGVGQSLVIAGCALAVAIAV
jgi:TRAP-type C4-dicarboxylate transport system permease small subunit